MGWKSFPSYRDTCRDSAPSMVVSGRSRGSFPARRLAALIPASSPDPADSMYPSTPVICPAKYSPGRPRKEKSPSSSLGESRNVFRCITPYRTNSALARPGIRPNTRFCSPNFKLVWKPTRLKRVPSRFSFRSCTTAQGRWPVRGSFSPTGFMGPKRMASCPREASTSMGMHPS